MAQETKVGLVVGLGFIVCFAMILANRSGAGRIRPQMPYQLFHSAAARNPSTTATSPEAQARQVGRVGTTAPDTEHTTPAALPSSDRRDPAVGRRGRGDRDTGVIADPERFTRRRRPVPTSADPADTLVVDAGDYEDPDANGMSLLVGEAATNVAENGPEPEPTGRRYVQTAAHESIPVSLRSYANQFERVRRGRKPAATTGIGHVVEKGETLTEIARRYYGSNSKAIVDAVFQANRSVLTSPDAVIAGRTLLLPKVQGRSPMRRPPPSDEQRVAVTAAAPAPPHRPEYRLYKVKKGDLLGTIAQKELGSAKRWKEILTLNKSIFSDARHLPCGAEIRIPLGTLADAG